MPEMLILCDFDGTITEQDVTNLIWDRYIPFDWRKELLPAYLQGTTSPVDVMVAGYKPISAPAREMIEYVRPRVALRSGFLSLFEDCNAKGWRFFVLSCGLDFYIRPFLPPEMKFFSLTAELNGTWHVKLPPGTVLRAGEDFKVNVLLDLKKRNPGRATVFIGDGLNDLPVAREADRVFAVKGSTLARMCRQERIAATEFTSFGEVVRSLQD